MAADVITPRLVYKGAPDADGSYEKIETKEVADQGALDAAIKDGFRLTRVPPADVPKADAKAVADANAKAKK